jgi:NADH:ubiquinone oxidoreductase subunit F (NADH-binding)
MKLTGRLQSRLRQSRYPPSEEWTFEPMTVTTSTTTLSALRLLPADQSKRETLAQYVATGGYAPAVRRLSAPELRRLVADSGLRGRGGGAFPTGRKWESVASQAGRKVLVVNAAESEPASAKDRLLVSCRPHSVLDGALLAAYAVGADECVLYLHTGQVAARNAFDAALHELRAFGWASPPWRIVDAPARYVAGEETAAIERINGRSAKPTVKPPRPFERGVRGRPTLVQNVETLANVPLIARHGADWFRALGAPDRPGTLLVTVTGSVRRPGVYEVPSGSTLIEVIDGLAGGTDDGQPVQAVLPGGCFSGWISGGAVRGGLRLDDADLAKHGAGVGSGALMVVSEGVCGLHQAARLQRFFADESVRQCGPCEHGTLAIADAFERIADGQPQGDDLRRIERWATATLPGRGACGHLDGATIAARSALTVFKDEIARHARRGDCGRPRCTVLHGLQNHNEERHGSFG